MQNIVWMKRENTKVRCHFLKRNSNFFLSLECQWTLQRLRTQSRQMWSSEWSNEISQLYTETSTQSECVHCAESTGGIFCRVVFFFYKTKESHVLYIFFITRTTKEKDGGGKSCGIISVLVLAIRGQTLSCCQHRPRNYDYNSITVLSPSLKSLFVQLFSPLVDPPVRSFLSRRVSWKAEP